MRLLKEIKERRLLHFMGVYLVTGFAALEGMDQVVSYEILPAIAYPLTLVLYLFGIPSSLLFAWFHGAPGRQYAPRAEVISQTIIWIVALVATGQVYRNRPASLDLAAESGLRPTSIAVLYFEDVSPGGDLAYVADGITEARIDQLDRVRSLDVISRNGVLPYRELDLREDSIARALKVGSIIDGTVDQSGDRLRITTRLVDGFSGADIERTVVEIGAGEFLAARDSVAESVSHLLRQQLGEEVQLRDLRATTTSVEAWSLAQRAERLRTQAEDGFEAGGETSVSVEAYHQADSLLAMAERADPSWVLPPGARARAAYRKAWFAAISGDMETAGAEVELGLGHANRALALDARDPNALEQRGTIKMLAFQLAIVPESGDRQTLLTEARADLEAAVEADPSLATAHDMLSYMFFGIGDYVSVVLSARRALEEDAYLRGADRIYDRLAYAQYDLEQFRDAQDWCDEGARRFPDHYRFIECQLWLMAVPTRTPDVDAAWALLARQDSLAPESLRDYKHGVGQIMVAGVLRNAGLPDSASSVLSQVDHSEEVDPQRKLFQYEAGIRASTGDIEGALQALRRWVSATPGSTLGSVGDLHWWFRDLRNRPEFQQFVARRD
jgi:TolB-like protein/tetratricopeptide (TPR) repeat protein